MRERGWEERREKMREGRWEERREEMREGGRVGGEKGGEGGREGGGEEGGRVPTRSGHTQGERSPTDDISTFLQHMSSRRNVNNQSIHL